MSSSTLDEVFADDIAKAVVCVGGGYGRAGVQMGRGEAEVLICIIGKVGDAQKLVSRGGEISQGVIVIVDGPADGANGAT